MSRLMLISLFVGVVGVAGLTGGAGRQPEKQEVVPAKKEGEPKWKASDFSALSARSIGPALMSGRVGDIAVNPDNHSEFYVAIASGNLWKTTNGGITFSPIFDGYGSFSIGCVTIDPTNSATVWVGSGENNSQRSVSFGDGVYVSRDGGKSFKNVGLPDSAHIGRIVVDPKNASTVYVAAMGPLWKSGGERGVFKTTDGGATWTRVLHISDDTGVNEVHMDPRDSNVLYATAYQRRRHVWTLINGGPESGIYKSVDAGKSWRKLESGIPGADKGKIGLAVSPVEPSLLYAIIECAEGEGGVFRSRNGGETWEKRSGYVASSPQYYNELFPDPKNADRFYTADTFMNVTDDGGATMKRLPIADVHVDFHAAWVDPNNTDHMLVGNDGGLYETFDRVNWRHFPNLPVTQFYRVAVDNSKPFYVVYGGTQDNNTQGVPSRTIDRAGITSDDCFTTTGGDGFESAVDPDDPNIVYSESQHAGLVRYDRRSGEEVDIKPREKPGEAPFVWNWDSPLLISPHSGKRLYIGSRIVHRSDDRGDSWTTISPDLTRKVDRNQLKVMGKVQKPDAVAKHVSTSIYGNIVSLCESPLVEGLIYVGTDDGLVQVTEDGGKNWRRIENFPVVPEMTYVSDLEASRHSADVVYATFDNHKNGDFAPYVLQSEDRGRSWKPIAGDLGKRDIVYAIAEDHVNPELLFVGTEFGAYFTLDGGKKWLKVSGLPTISVRDLEIQRRENDLVIATFGRGFYVLDDYAVLRSVTEEDFEKPSMLWPSSRPALSYVEMSRLGGQRGRGSVGADYYTAKNPPFGAVLTYRLKDKVTNRKEKRKEAEKKEGWAYPTVEQFKEEDREQAPKVYLTIRDVNNQVVRRLEVAREAGMHRVAWNLRYPEATPVSLGGGSERAPWEIETDGVLAPPGKYTARLSKLVDGAAEDLGEAVTFEVVDLGNATLWAKDGARSEKFEFERKVTDLQRAVEGVGRVVDDALNRAAHLAKAANDTPGTDQGVLAELEALRQRLTELRVILRGDPTLARRLEPEGPSVSDRVNAAMANAQGSTQPPTGTQREQYGYACEEFEKALGTVRALVEKDLRDIEAKLETAGAPWTPGRMPEWKRK